MANTHISENMDTYKDIQQRVGTAIKLYRKMNGVEIDQLAKCVGVSLEQLRNMENGSGFLPIDKLVLVFRYLGIPYELLFVNDSKHNVYFQDQFVRDYNKLTYTSLQIIREFTHTLAEFQRFNGFEDSLRHIQSVMYHEYEMLTKLLKMEIQINDSDEYAQIELSKEDISPDVAFNVSEALLNTDIQDTNLPIRVRNIFYVSKYRAKYKTVRDLADATVEDLMKLEGMGKASIKAITEFLDVHGFSLSEE